MDADMVRLAAQLDNAVGDYVKWKYKYGTVRKREWRIRLRRREIIHQIANDNARLQERADDLQNDLTNIYEGGALNE